MSQLPHGGCADTEQHVSPWHLIIKDMGARGGCCRSGSRLRLLPAVGVVPPPFLMAGGQPLFPTIGTTFRMLSWCK